LFRFIIPPTLGPVPAALWYNVQLLLQDTPQPLIAKVAPVKTPCVTSFSSKFEDERREAALKSREPPQVLVIVCDLRG